MAAIVVPLSHLAWPSGNITAWLASQPWATYAPTTASLHPDQLWPHTGKTSLLIGARIVPAAALLALATAAVVLWSRHRPVEDGRSRSPAWPSPRTSSP
ncbi:hypothetical protein SHIRM173S_09201 [Streptomyces hirsutus]